MIVRYLGFILLLCIVSCTQPIKPATFSAAIENTEAEEVVITKNDFIKKIKIASGVAKDTLMIPSDGLYNVRIGRNSSDIYFTKSGTVDMAVDVKDFGKSLKITSPNQAIQDYTIASNGARRSLFGRDIYGMEPNDYLARLNKGKDTLMSIIESAKLPAAYASTEKENIDLNIKRLKYIYPDYADKEPADLPADFQNVLDGVDLTDEAKYLSSNDYKNLVNNQFSMTMYRDTTDTYENVFMKNIKALASGNIKNQLLYGDLRYLMGPNEKLEDFYQFFNDHSTNAKHKTKIDEQYADFQKLKKGEISPKFDYENYKGGNTSLDDLSGKYVYIDVWATWCGPCIGEIPSLKKVEKQYHNKNIEFVSISIDNKEDYDKWRKMIGDRELGGTQLMAENAWQSQFAQDYKINGIPRFILIDPQGKIVSADAPRPSDEKLIEKFEELSI